MLAGDQQQDQTTATSDNNDNVQNSTPSISLPKGGGAIRGMGEKFAANPVTGTGSLSIPIAASPGRAGFGPQLSLTYDSGAGNGPFGLGWNLSTPSITRKTDKGLPRYWDADESDEFILSGAEDLVPVLVQNDDEWVREALPRRTLQGNTYRIQRYRPRIEGLFARIERWTNQDDPSDSFWRSISRDNVTTWYGRTDESRIFDPGDPTHIFSWLICESYDDKGNVISYSYKPEDSVDLDLSQIHEANRTDASRSANRYLKHIHYGNREPYFPLLTADSSVVPLPSEWLFEVVFDYGEHDQDNPLPDDDGIWPVRHDPFSSYRAGFEVRTYRLCQRVLMFHHFPDEVNDPNAADISNEFGVGTNCLVRSSDFQYRYEQDPADSRNPIHTVLVSVTQSAYKRLTEDSYRKRTLPAVEFEYNQAQIHEEIQDMDPESLENLPRGLDNTRYQWVDLDGEGLSGVLTEQGDGWFYKRNLSPVNVRVDGDGRMATKAQFAPLEHMAAIPSLTAISSGGQQLLDLAGDGQLDLAEFDSPIPGFFERTPNEDWEPFKSFESLPVLNWSDPNLRFVDLTGDGHADILITEHEALCWHTSLAEAGFGPSERVSQALDEEQGPRLVFADGTQSIYLADLSGDGLIDLARIRNGEVCYWPNLGYGRFGAKVTMDNAPWFDAPDQFDQRRIRLADIDGSGVTDILYLNADGVQIYLNQSGNSWSDARRLTQLPKIDDLSAVQVVDLLGNGTACLVWSSPLPGDARQPMRYIDLMGGQKPHLMIASRNNLGAETRVHYAPSTKFYVQDRLDGNPWITRIPFVVHVVERVETFDHISRNRFVTRYAYHHGYFDGIDREFRGFGMVEQFDTEEFDALSASGELPTGDNIEESSHVPPVHTKTWFHTGPYLGGLQISIQFAKDYYGAPLSTEDDYETRLAEFTNSELLPDTILPGGLTVEEEREACRALKGAMLRQEVYARDGTDREAHPYTVVEQNFNVKMLQPERGNRHAVFFTHPRESLSYHYEREHNPADPRVSHALTLAVDDYGNVLQTAAIGYGR
ncbi:MAG: SpvB/TcaC N-terminal domain-containing protein, partial [Desulfobacterales bacterium]